MRKALLCITLPALLLGSALLVGCENDLEASAPHQLFGFWVTDHPQYVDRAFEISESAIVFYTGPEIGDFTAHPILGTVAEERGSATIYRIEYPNSAGTVLTFSLRLDPHEPGVVRLPDQPLITWRRGNSRARRPR